MNVILHLPTHHQGQEGDDHKNITYHLYGTLVLGNLKIDWSLHWINVDSTENWGQWLHAYIHDTLRSLPRACSVKEPASSRKGSRSTSSISRADKSTNYDWRSYATTTRKLCFGRLYFARRLRVDEQSNGSRGELLSIPLLLHTSSFGLRQREPVPKCPALSLSSTGIRSYYGWWRRNSNKKHDRDIGPLVKTMHFSAMYQCCTSWKWSISPLASLTWRLKLSSTLVKGHIRTWATITSSSISSAVCLHPLGVICCKQSWNCNCYSDLEWVMRIFRFYLQQRFW